jgi:phage gpG-like protein
MATVSVKVLSAEVQKRLQEMQAAAQNTRPAFDAIGRVLSSRIRLGFRSSRGPSGAPWLPLKHRIGQPLRDTGRLQRSITHRASAKDVVVGTNLKYAPLHQFGGTILPKNAPFLAFKSMKGTPGETMIFARKVKIPARPFFPLDRAGNIALPPLWAKSALAEMAKALKVPA